MSMVFDKMILPVSDQGYSIVREAVVSVSLPVDGILCSDGLSFFTFSFMSIQSNFSFMFCSNVAMSNAHSTGNFD